jgi:hypothetical protein
MLIAVLNYSTHVTAAQASTMTRAVSWQVNNHLCPAWGLLRPAITYYRNVEDVPPGAIRALIADTADVAGALGYHDQGPDGAPYLRCFVDVTLAAGGSILGPGIAVSVDTALAVSTVLSHEIVELLGDPECNLWAQRGDGLLICRELGDPVQGTSYNVTVTTGKRHELVAVSNFVLPAWFDTAPGDGARFDQLGHLSAPFTLEAGGYQIWTDGKQYGNEFGSTAGIEALVPRAMDKLHPAARTRRRYDRLEALGAAADQTPRLAAGTTWS